MADVKADTKKTGIADFIRETRMEMAKVTWPSRQEVMAITSMIVVMALVASVFFLAVDGALSYVISHLLGIRA